MLARAHLIWHFFLLSLFSLFSEEWVSSSPLNCLPPPHSCLLQRWVQNQPSTRRSSYPTMRRCLLLCKWSGGPRRRSPSWPPVVRETTWPSSASQVRTRNSLLSSLLFWFVCFCLCIACVCVCVYGLCSGSTNHNMSSLILPLMFTLMSMFTFPLPIEWQLNQFAVGL